MTSDTAKPGSSVSPDGLMQSLKGFDRRLEDAPRKGIYPPVDKWNPPFSGDLDMEIRRDGTWYYMGSPITRNRMVKLFASVLRHDDDGRYYLVTPVEKVGIRVEDAPLFAVAMEAAGEGRDQILTFRTLTGDVVAADADHPIRVTYDRHSQEPSPYVLVRSNLEARINRSVFYELVDLATEEEVDGTTMFGVWSSGTFFPFAPADAIRA